MNRTISRRDRHPGGDAGFTLLEMIVVLAILSLTIAATTVSVTGSRGVVRLQPLAVRVAADLKLARTEAVTQNRSVEVVFDAKANAYQIQGSRSAVALPAAIAFKLVTPEEFRRTTDSAHLVFFPDGSSTGGRLTLTDRSLSITLVIDWLTGAVTARRAPQ